MRIYADWEALPKVGKHCLLFFNLKPDLPHKPIHVFLKFGVGRSLRIRELREALKNCVF